MTRRPIRRAALLLGFVAGALLAGAACGAKPVSPADCQATKPTQQGSLLVLQADPAESSIRAVVPGSDAAKAGRPYTVRWLVDARKAGGDIRIQAAREGTSQVYRATFTGTPPAGQVAQFPADLVFPDAGCWDADVFTGTALGSLTFRVA